MDEVEAEVAPELFFVQRSALTRADYPLLERYTASLRHTTFAIRRGAFAR